MAPASEAVYRRLAHKRDKDVIAEAVRMAHAISIALRN